MSGSILERALRFLECEVKPQAQEIDANTDALRAAMDGMAKNGFLAMRRSAEFGGPAMPEGEFRTFQEEVARVSGSLSFLQTQQQSAVSLIAKGSNEALKREYLPRMASASMMGIGFSQLRRPGPPIMRAEETPTGFTLTGHVPWVTGWTFYPEFLIGAALPDGRSVFAVAPLSEQPGIKIGAPMKLAAMESALTVTADFEAFAVPFDRVSNIVSPGWIQQNDQINVALQRHFALGCARAGLDIFEVAMRKKGTSFLEDSYQTLCHEFDACRAAASAESSEDLSTDSRLEARAWAIDLAVRCAHAAIAATGGSANSQSHPAQRVYREALVYTVSAQTPPIMEATIRRLLRPV